MAPARIFSRSVNNHLRFPNLGFFVLTIAISPPLIQKSLEIARRRSNQGKVVSKLKCPYRPAVK
jgi:hypothetical protein